jgi:hypothetical protein
MISKFVSTSGKVFFGKESEKACEEKSVEKPSEEKPSEQPQPKPIPKLVRFHCGYCRRYGHKDEFCFKRKREERMAKEWANKDKYHPPNGVLEPRVHMPRAKASVRTVPALGERKAVGGAAGRATPVRPVRGTGQTGAGLDRQQFGFRAHTGVRFGYGGRGSVVGLDSLQEVSLLGVLPLVLNMGMGVVALRWRGGTVHGFPFVVLVLLRVDSLFVRLISHQPVVLFSQNKPATSNQPAVLFSRNKLAPAISHQPNEQAERGMVPS